MSESEVQEIKSMLIEMRTRQEIESKSNDKAHEDIKTSINELYKSRNEAEKKAAVIEFKTGQIWIGAAWLLGVIVVSVLGGITLGSRLGK